ncbi:MAG: outer membrane lipoprotein-sorting protein [Spirochaetes bacterium]|nr:outer membrane lipoprotein-sorting protein [Spirochaetota bacterium]
MKKVFLTTLLIIIFIFFTAQTQKKIDPVKVIRDIENKLNYDEDITTTLNIIQVDPNSSNKVYKLRWYRRDKEDKFVLIFIEPDSEKGKGYLRIKDDFYMYLPATREFVYKNRKENVGDTNAKAESFEKMKTEELYDISYLKDEKVAKFDTYVILLKAKKLDVSYPIQKIYVDKESMLPVKREYFSQSEKLMQTDYYIKYEKLKGEKYIATKILIVDNIEEGKKTSIMIEDFSISKIPDYIFTKAFLENQSR